MTFRLGLDISCDSFPEDFDIKDGMDVTEILKKPTPFFPRPTIPEGYPIVKAVVSSAVGPGGGNPYVYFHFNNPDDALKWFYEVYEEGSGLSDEEIEEEFEMAAYAN